MNYFIKNIALDSQFEDYNLFDEGDYKEKVLQNLSKINILVGANNSGKSRFMRFLTQPEQYKFTPNIEFQAINETKEKIATTIKQFADNRQLANIEGLLWARNLKGYDLIDERTEYKEEVNSILNKIFNSRALAVTKGNITGNDEHSTTALQKELSGYKKEFEFLYESIPDKFSFKKLYIPALRGLRTLSNDNDDFYKARTLKDYFPGKSFKPDIFTGLDLYEKIKNLLLGNLEERKSVKEFEIFLSETFFEKKPVALIPRKDSDVLYVKIGVEDERPIHELGDGIQSIITLVFPLFELQGEALLVFIEEPEIYMHPGLQRVFMDTLLKFDNHQFFFHNTFKSLPGSHA